MTQPRLKPLDDLLPLASTPVQAYFSNRIQLAEVIEWVLVQTGPADICISTFSTGEEFLRRFSRIREKGLVRSCSLFCDLKAARKTVAVYDFISGVFDRVFLCMNHSKVVLFHTDSLDVALVTSQNQTRGDRNEAGVITTDCHVIEVLTAAFDSLTKNSMPLDRLFKGNNRQNI